MCKPSCFDLTGGWCAGRGGCSTSSAIWLQIFFPYPEYQAQSNELKLTEDNRLKCDRQKPCQNCKAREQGTHCVYASDEGRANRGGQLLNLSTDVGDRIRELEALVSSMLTAQQAASGLPIQNTGQLASVSPPSLIPNSAVDANGYHKVDSELQHDGPYAALVGTGDGQQFLGPSRWEAVLRDVSSDPHDDESRETLDSIIGMDHQADGVSIRSLRLGNQLKNHLTSLEPLYL